MPETSRAGEDRAWWKRAIFYQVYPRSFMDSNGDGIGDLPGLIEKLDYLAGLGVDAIWLSPHFDSPNADNGYDIRDYRKIMSEFGTMADFDRLVAKLKRRGMRLIIDLVVNHTSDEHAWFIGSRNGTPRYRDYYLWRDGRNGGPPNDWQSFFSGPAWTFDAARGQYYLHLFIDKQPDLNWDNPAVRADIIGIMRFWLNKGVDGFRMDVIPFISKDQTFPDYPEHLRSTPHIYHAGGPRLHEYLKLMRDEVLGPHQAIAIGEAFGVSLEELPKLIDQRRSELDMAFHFEAVRQGRAGSWQHLPWTLPQLKAIYRRINAALDDNCWPTVFLSNHDSPRLVSHFGDDAVEWRELSAKALATLVLTMRGTPFIYQGDELGMTNYPFADIAEFDDVESRNAWTAEVETARMEAGAFMAQLARVSRDNSRTPMQWSPAPNAGFTTGARPWMPVNPNHTVVNAEEALGRAASIYYYYARLAGLRRATPALTDGDFTDLAPDDEHLYVFTRRVGKEACLVMLNFSRTPRTVAQRPGFAAATLLLSNDGSDPLNAARPPELGGWGACVYRLQAG